MSRRRKKKCQHCGERFKPSAQNVDKQCYCSKAECKKASRREANQRWVKKNADYHKGAEAVQRVQVWRAANPGYWQAKEEGLTPTPLQDDCIAQVVDDEGESAALTYFALQDDSISQALVLLGLISHLMGSALQDDIAQTSRALHKQGRQILGTRLGVFARNPSTENHAKTSSRHKTPTARAGPV
jgi:hypothetical protein